MRGLIVFCLASGLHWTPANATVLFEDSFDNGTATGWTEFGQSWRVESGIYRVTANGVNPGLGTTSVAPPISAGDYRTVWSRRG